ncbi:MAG: beta-ketoacyl-ACP reductase [Saprospirales bacterium]|jgi:3-oxoacyl-[acyl-carrier protein] reductase|nr:beta-ketoacyl-ACP reductase [Saprospirales bacterium]MBK6904387.1 beta-ketoacyl-ACP reductase [Saprospirales bacterium]MBK7338224.1 beta-ketoacyl-ACP reductase [Saprospirales bacterium]
MKRLQDRVAIITGGANGIGLATTRRFAEDGARVAIWDISKEKGEAVAEAFRAEGKDVVFFQVNTTDYPAVEAAAKAVFDRFGRIDILINNAGITRDASMKKITLEQWDQVISVNLSGVFHCTKAVHPYMAEAGFGRIVSASSVVGIYGNFGQTNYAATKAGVIGMTKVWAREFGRKGITANAVAPGFIATEMMGTIPEEVLQQLREKTPAGRLGKPEEIAAAYAFLASEDAAFINGTVLSVDGGLVL